MYHRQFVFLGWPAPFLLLPPLQVCSDLTSCVHHACENNATKYAISAFYAECFGLCKRQQDEVFVLHSMGCDKVRDYDSARS